MKRFLIGNAIAVGLGTVLSAQAPPPTTTTPPPRPQSRATATSSASALSVMVTDKSGNGLGDVNVAISGPVERAGHTAADGSVGFRSLRGGIYRLRFEHERYITLEREVVVGTRAADVSVALNPAPVVKPVVAPPQPVTPPPVQQSKRVVEPRTLSMSDFLEKNLIGSEPQKTSLFACTDGGAARILQIKEPLTNHVNDDADEVFYVVVGSGSVRLRDQDYKAGPGLLLLIPRGVPVGARREGRNPLIALTVTMGAACTDSTPLAK